jgi:hypothetical protein
MLRRFLKWMYRRSLIRYLAEHWITLLVTSSLSLGIVHTAYSVAGESVTTIVRTHGGKVGFGTLTVGAAVGLLAWRRAISFFRRYRRTYHLSPPPLIYTDVGAVLVATSLITLWLLILGYRLPDATWAIAHPFLTSAGLGGIAWLAAGLVWSLRSASENLSAPSNRMSGLDFSDEPIWDEGQDALRRTPFVQALYEQIVHLPFPDAFVFGLTGAWGEGKTSVLNLLSKRLQKTADIILVPFNPWYVRSNDALAKQFYDAVERALDHRYIVSGLHRLFKRYREVLAPGMKPGLKALGISFELTTPDSPEHLRRELEEWIARTGSRLVVIVDDIDRLERAEVFEVFKLVALTARLKGTTFVLSYDEVVVRRMCRGALQADDRFIEKIVQKPVALPPPESRDIDRFLLFSDSALPEEGVHRSAIDRLLDELKISGSRRKEFDDRFTQLYRSHLRKLFRTLRDAKRYVNGLRAGLSPVLDDVDLCDFFILEAIRVFSLAVYRDIWRQRWFYIPAWSTDLMLEAPRDILDDKQRHATVKAHIQKLLESDPNAEVMQELLTDLFFVEVKNAFAKSPIGHSSMGKTYRAAKRLTHPDCFPRYFLYRVPFGELPDHEAEATISRWNGERDPERCEEMVTESLRTFQEREQRWEFLRKVQLFSEQVVPESVAPVVRAITRIASSLSVEGGLWESERDTALRLVVALIDGRAREDEVQSLSYDVVKSTNSTWFYASFVASVQGRQTLERLQKLVNLPGLRQLAAAQLRAHYIEAQRDIFAEASLMDAIFILYRWVSDWDTGTNAYREEVMNYAGSMLARDPRRLGALLLQFCQRRSDEDVGGFEYDSFVQVFEPKTVLRLLDEHGDTIFAKPRERKAAEVFRQVASHALSSAGDAPDPGQNLPQ